MNTFLASPDAAKFSFGECPQLCIAAGRDRALRCALTRSRVPPDLHFWIGAESTQDEYGVAAYKTVELDDLLGGDPVQHRQVMGNESSLFLSYFPNGLIIKSGGIESGFRKVKPQDYKPTLLQVQRAGKECRAFEVDLVRLATCHQEHGVACAYSAHAVGRRFWCVLAQSIESMDSTDCFILDAGAKIYVYHGPESSAFEKQKATSLGETMEGERAGRSERVDREFASRVDACY
jgi:hypothetical protein